MITFTGCDKSDHLDESITDYGNLFDYTYTINDDGCCVLEGLEPAGATVIEDEVAKYGWKVVGIFEVQDDGRLSRTDYRTTVYGSGYTDYWFEADGHLIGFQHGDVAGKSYDKTEWSYDAATGFIMRGPASQSTQSRYMQVLRFTKTESRYRQMYTLQKLGITSDEHGDKPFYAMVVYQRMTDKELAEIKNTYGYDANIDFPGAVPNDCKFRVSVQYSNPDESEEETDGSVLVTFGDVTFSLTDHLGTTLLPNPALEYFDYIVWRTDDRNLPDRYVIHRQKQGQAQTTLTWTTRFFYTNSDLTSYFDGYKNGRVVYTYTMRHNVYNDSSCASIGEDLP